MLELSFFILRQRSLLLITPDLRRRGRPNTSGNPIYASLPILFSYSYPPCAFFNDINYFTVEIIKSSLRLDHLSFIIFLNSIKGYSSSVNYTKMSSFIKYLYKIIPNTHQDYLNFDLSRPHLTIPLILLKSFTLLIHRYHL